MFLPERGHRKTCSGACKVAKHRALKLASDADIVQPWLRRECYSQERKNATGFGLMTRRELYEADMRVRQGGRAGPRVKGPPHPEPLLPAP